MSKLGLFGIIAVTVVMAILLYNRDQSKDEGASSVPVAVETTTTPAVATTYIGANVPAPWDKVAGVVTSEQPVYNEPRFGDESLSTDTTTTDTSTAPRIRSWTLPAGTPVIVKCKAGLPYSTSDGRFWTPDVFVYYDSGQPSIQGQGFISGNGIHLNGRTPNTNELISMEQVKLC